MSKWDATTVKTVKEPPYYCQYASGACDQEFRGVGLSKAVFLYPSQPAHIASTIESAVGILREKVPVHNSPQKWRTWKDFPVAGQMIFCEICKMMRFADAVIADVTTLNFNLMFEIGFGLGLKLPVIPIRDTTIVTSKRDFEELGLLDTIGYIDFQNAASLAESIRSRMPFKPLPVPTEQVYLDAPVYVVRSSIDTDGYLRMVSLLNNSGIKFRTYDLREVSRISIQEARKQVGMSIAVAGHLLSPDRQGAAVHNARCALIAGIALAQGKRVMLLQEGKFLQPLDYRDIVSSYSHPDQVESPTSKLILHVITKMQDAKIRAVKAPSNLLERLDLGDVAAENEVNALKSYFVRTAQFQEAKRGKARLVVGRKGSGKTAIFYSVLTQIGSSRARIVVELKPEGHHFSQLREVVLSKLSEGFQEHTLTAFWNYILLCEIAHEAIESDSAWAQLDFERRKKFDRLVRAYDQHRSNEVGDFSERLLKEVERISLRYKDAKSITTPGELTQALFRDDIKILESAVMDFVAEKESIWLLIDNLDKGWPTRGASDADILILRTLLEACRKLQRQLSDPKVNFHPLIFLRNDIFEHLVLKTPDKGKDSVIGLDYDDAEVFKEIVCERLKACTGMKGEFDDLWAAVFDTHIGTVGSFNYIIERTLMRPRDLLNFLRSAVEVAINRGHERVKQEDILKAEENYSEDILLALSFEIRDVLPQVNDPLYGFLGCAMQMDHQKVYSVLKASGFPDEELDKALKLLIWFGFLGVKADPLEPAKFSYQVRYNIDKLLAPARQRNALFVVHPAFRKALECLDYKQPLLDGLRA